MIRKRMFRKFPGCPGASRWDKIGMIIMLISFAGIVVATVGSLIHLPVRFNGPLMFAATYVGVAGYLCTAHASSMYVKFVQKKWNADNRQKESKPAGNKPEKN